MASHYDATEAADAMNLLLSDDSVTGAQFPIFYVGIRNEKEAQRLLENFRLIRNTLTVSGDEITDEIRPAAIAADVLVIYSPQKLVTAELQQKVSDLILGRAAAGQVTYILGPGTIEEYKREMSGFWHPDEARFSFVFFMASEKSSFEIESMLTRAHRLQELEAWRGEKHRIAGVEVLDEELYLIISGSSDDGSQDIENYYVAQLKCGIGADPFDCSYSCIYEQDQEPNKIIESVLSDPKYHILLKSRSLPVVSDLLYRYKHKELLAAWQDEVTKAEQQILEEVNKKFQEGNFHTD